MEKQRWHFQESDTVFRMGITSEEEIRRLF